MKELFEAMREHNKKVRMQKNEKFEPMLIDIGAIKKSSGVYEFGDYFCYPTKGFAMHKKTYKKQSLIRFIERAKK